MVEQAAFEAREARSEKRSRLYELDLLRFIAALAVVLLHYTFSGFLNGRSDVDLGPTLGGVTKYGYLGVDLFFMISGFVVFMSSWGRSASQFVVSRVARLYPAYWVALTVTTIVVAAGWAKGRDGVSLLQYLVNLTMFQAPLGATHVEAVYWTLWAEWRFYGLLFLFILLGLTHRRTIVFMWGWLGVSSVLTFLPMPGKELMAIFVQPLFAQYFVAGMALFLVFRWGWTLNLGLLVAVCWALGVYQGIVRSRAVAGTENATYSSAIVAIIITVLFILMALVASGVLSRFGRPLFVHLGTMTYPLYLIHATVGYALLNWLAPAVNPWMLVVAVTITMCAVSWLIASQVEDRVRPVLRRELTKFWTRVGSRRRTG